MACGLFLGYKQLSWRCDRHYWSTYMDKCGNTSYLTLVIPYDVFDDLNGMVSCVCLLCWVPWYMQFVKWPFPPYVLVVSGIHLTCVETCLSYLDVLLKDWVLSVFLFFYLFLHCIVPYFYSDLICIASVSTWVISSSCAFLCWLDPQSSYCLAPF